MPYSPFLRCSVSTHSLARRLTYLPLYNKWGRLCFNSQPRKEADIICSYIHHVSDVSTHSLARRLTENPHHYGWASGEFQLTASQGGWHFFSIRIILPRCFNSQPRKEADDLSECSLRFTPMFQLTASQGGWPDTGFSGIAVGYVSTHSLARRLTSCDIYIDISSAVSTHSLARRLTVLITIMFPYLEGFNSQPRKEADVWNDGTVCLR